MLELSIIQKCLIFCAGRNAELAQKTSHAEVQTICTIGTLVLIPTILAFVSSVCAVWLISHNWLYAIAGGVAWAFVILLADRAVVSYGRSKKIDRAFIARASLAIVSSFAISIFTEVALFNDAIAEQQAIEAIDQLDGVAAKYQTKIADLLDELAFAKEILDNKESAYLKEGDGEGGSKKRGTGAIFREKKDAYERELTTYQALEAKIEQRIATLQSQQRTEQEQLSSSFATGILGSFQALHAVESPIVAFAAWVVRIFLLLLDLLPVLIKITPTGRTDLYYQIADADDTAKLKSYKMADTERLRVFHQKEKQSLALQEFAIAQQHIQGIINTNSANYYQTSQQLKNLAKEHAKSRKQIEKLVPDYILREALLIELEKAYENTIATISTLLEKSNQLNTQLTKD